MTAGQVHGSRKAVEILSQLNIQGSNILTDKAYGTREIREYIEGEGGRYTIPSKSNTKEKWECDYHTYKERHLVECFFNKLKRFRRLGTRYDKLAASFINFIYLGCIIILLK